MRRELCHFAKFTAHSANGHVSAVHVFNLPNTFNVPRRERAASSITDSSFIFLSQRFHYRLASQKGVCVVQWPYS